MLALVAERRFPTIEMKRVGSMIGGALQSLALTLVALAPVLLPIAIWVYTLVFAFSALWFGHFLLAALAALRDEPAEPAPPPPLPGTPPLLGADA